MKLVNQQVLDLPPLYSTEKIKFPDKIVGVKFFYPYGAPTWLAVEYSPEENICFGYTDLYGNGDGSWGYFSIEEMEENRVERDEWFTPKKFSDCLNDRSRICV